jgi:hypothetical protein
MLYTISRNNVPGAEGEQYKIVHLVLNAESLFAAGGCVFTDGHAIGVYDAACAEEVTRALAGVPHRPAIVIKPEWYY